MRSSLARAGIFVIALSLACPIGAAEAPLAFSTPGGDAWAFRKTVDITVANGRCDQVAIVAPLGTIVAPPQKGHVRAEVPLAPGDNRIEAECREPGGASGPVAQQD